MDRQSPDKNRNSALALRLNVKKCVGTLQKQTIDKNFNIQNSQLLILSSPTKEIFQIQGKNQFVANLSFVVFVLSLKNATTKATEYVTFAFSFRIWCSSLSRKA